MRLAFLLGALMALFAASAAPAAPVGFTTVRAADVSRGDLRRGPGPRPFLLYIWYPAQAGPGDLTYGDYFRFFREGRALGEVWPSPAPDEFALLAERIGALGGSNAHAALAALASRPVQARLNGRPASGRFPLVIFPEGHAPALGSQLAERLAASGFVVVGFPEWGPHEPDFSPDLAGIESDAADILFVLSEAQRLPYVDGERVAAMGLGMHASAALVAAMRSNRIDALVSLDGGIPTLFEDRFLRRTPFYSMAAVDLPILGLMGTHESLDPGLWRQYRYSDRWIVRFPQMTEFEFLNLGAWSRDFPGIGGPSRGDAVTGQDWAYRWVEQFLRATLRREPEAQAFLSAATGAAAPSAVFTAERLLPLPAPPTFGDWKRLVERGGIAALEARYRELRGVDPEPISAAVFAALYTFVDYRDRGNPRSPERLRLAQLRRVAFPGSARAHLVLGQLALAFDDPALAVTELTAALRLLPLDPDPELTLDRREALRRQAEARLNEAQAARR